MSEIEMEHVSGAALAAAAWWGERLGLALTNGTDDGPSAVLQLYAQALRPVPTSDEAGRFVSVLAAKINEFLGRIAGNAMPKLNLGVDYGPDPMLAEAAAEAGVRSAFPIKTRMWIDENTVVASLGYRGEARLVWASEEWLADRPKCAQQWWDPKRSDDEDYHGDPFACGLDMYHEGAHDHSEPLSFCVVCGRPEVALAHHLDVFRRHDFQPSAPVVQGSAK